MPRVALAPARAGGAAAKEITDHAIHLQYL